MDEIDGRIRDALAGLTASEDADRVLQRASARLAQGPTRRRMLAFGVPHAALATAATLALAIAVAGAVLVGRQEPAGSSSPSVSPTPGAETGADGGDIDALLTVLQDAGASVAVIDRFVPNPDVLGDEGHQLCVDGQRVTAYVFASADAASAVAGMIDRDDPSHIGQGLIIEWAGDPRFWLTGSVLVLYLGPQPGIERTLTSLLGPPFARGSGRAPDASHFAC